MAVHHKYPRKLYNTLTGDLSTEGGRDGYSEVRDGYDFALKMRKEKEKNPSLFKELSKLTGIKAKRIGQISRMAGDDPTHEELSAIRAGMAEIRRASKSKNREKGR